MKNGRWINELASDSSGVIDGCTYCSTNKKKNEVETMKKAQKNKPETLERELKQLKHDNQVLQEVVKVYQAHLEKVILKNSRY